jgi:hypothetical protein
MASMWRTSSFTRLDSACTSWTQELSEKAPGSGNVVSENSTQGAELAVIGARLQETGILGTSCGRRGSFELSFSLFNTDDSISLEHPCCNGVWLSLCGQVADPCHFGAEPRLPNLPLVEDARSTDLPLVPPLDEIPSIYEDGWMNTTQQSFLEEDADVVLLDSHGGTTESGDYLSSYLLSGLEGETCQPSIVDPIAVLESTTSTDRALEESSEMSHSELSAISSASLSPEYQQESEKEDYGPRRTRGRKLNFNYHLKVADVGMKGSRYRASSQRKIQKVAKAAKLKLAAEAKEENESSSNGVVVPSSVESSSVTYNQGKWTDTESSRLRHAVNLYGNRNWPAISGYVGTRTRQQCLHRWRKSENPTLKKGMFSAEEDALLQQAVSKYGVGAWKLVSLCLPGRSDSACRERYRNALDPSVHHKQGWTAEEDELLCKLVQAHGKRWAVVAESMHGRNDYAVRKRYLLLEKRIL